MIFYPKGTFPQSFSPREGIGGKLWLRQNYFFHFEIFKNGPKYGYFEGQKIEKWTKNGLFCTKTMWKQVIKSFHIVLLQNIPFLVHFSIFWPSKYPYFDPILANIWKFLKVKNIFVEAIARPPMASRRLKLCGNVPLGKKIISLKFQPPGGHRGQAMTSTKIFFPFWKFQKLAKIG